MMDALGDPWHSVSFEICSLTSIESLRGDTRKRAVWEWSTGACEMACLRLKHLTAPDMLRLRQGMEGVFHSQSGLAALTQLEDQRVSEVRHIGSLFSICVTWSEREGFYKVTISGYWS